LILSFKTPPHYKISLTDSIDSKQKTEASNSEHGQIKQYGDWTHAAFLARESEIHLSPYPGTLLGPYTLLNGFCDFFLEGRCTTQ
jgi:hypothetical protein